MELYKSTKKFIKDVCDPYVVGFKLITDEKLKTMKSEIQALYDLCLQTIQSLQSSIMTFAASKQLEIHQTESEIGADYTELESNLSTHTTNYNNPHSVSVSQMTTMSTLPPASAQGNEGDVWIEYNNS